VLFLLDTDVVTILLGQSGPSYQLLRSRLDQHLTDQIATTIVSFQEQVQGWMAFLNQARTPSGVLLAYSKLQDLLRDYSQMHVLPYDLAAQSQFTALQAQRIRLGTMDLRIGSIALAHGAVLITKNLRDFRQIPGLAVEDWTI
jgi:tRNA(fMet)-specific endonuclease VapC